MWHIKIGSMLIQHIIINLLLIHGQHTNTHTHTHVHFVQLISTAPPPPPMHSFDQLCDNSKSFAICITLCNVLYLSSVRFGLSIVYFINLSSKYLGFCCQYWSFLPIGWPKHHFATSFEQLSMNFACLLIICALFATLSIRNHSQSAFEMYCSHTECDFCEISMIFFFESRVKDDCDYFKWS